MISAVSLGWTSKLPDMFASLDRQYLEKQTYLSRCNYQQETYQHNSSLNPITISALTTYSSMPHLLQKNAE